MANMNIIIKNIIVFNKCVCRHLFERLTNEKVNKFLGDFFNSTINVNLITNDAGKFAFLSKEEFEHLLKKEKLKEEKYKELEKKGIYLFYS